MRLGAGFPGAALPPALEGSEKLPPIDPPGGFPVGGFLEGGFGCGFGGFEVGRPGICFSLFTTGYSVTTL